MYAFRNLMCIIQVSVEKQEYFYIWCASFDSNKHIFFRQLQIWIGVRLVIGPVSQFDKWKEFNPVYTIWILN